MKTIWGRFRAALLMAAAVSVLTFAVGARAQDHNDNDGPRHNDNTWPYATTGRSPVLAVVGDIACQPGTEGPGESGSEVCTDPAPPTPPLPSYTNTSLWQSQEATANQIETMKPDAVALLGDLQYQVGRFLDFEGSFDWTYGAFKFLHRPSPGNHEFYDEHGQTGVAGYGYFAYYNGFLVDTNNDASLGQPLTVTISDPCPTPNASCKAGKTPAASLSPQPIPRADGQAGHFEETGGVETAKYANGPAAGTMAPVGIGDGWYSYNMGSWHLISLNIQCYTQPDKAGSDGCSGTNAWFASELAWLKKDLEQNHSACTLAYWHQPAYSAADSLSEEGTTSLAFWQLLYQYGADVVLNGHDHLYARYRPLDPLGNYDPTKGIREFIVGTGGETLDPVASSSTGDAGAKFNAANLEVSTGDFWGVMALTLDKNGYKWDFEPALQLPGVPPPAGAFSDTGFGTCHGPVNRDRDDDDHGHDR